ncbi:MAG: oligosaccharide repeat unit polymerase [Lutibacter sp.]|nr:oligosaccharide repeat unit polymerase [Lutibacter sp.]
MSSQTDSQIISTNLIVSVYNCVFLLGYGISFNQSIKLPKIVTYKLNKSSTDLTIIVIFFLHLLFSLLAGYNLTTSVFFDLFGGYNPISLIIDIVFKSIVLYLFIFYVCTKRNKFTLPFIILTYLFFYYNNPIASSRFYAFMVYLLIIILFLRGLSKVKFFFNFIFLFGVIGSFYQNVIRAAFTPVSGANENSNFFDLNYFFQGHFDSYENLSNTITFVQKNGILWGNQLLGVILFWFPRSIWTEKPEGSGTFLGRTFYSFDTTNQNLNISAPLVMEEYLNFGLFGVILFTYALGYFTAKLDSKYTLINFFNLKYENGRIEDLFFNYIFYFSFLGIFLFILRGDLLSSFSYTVGIYISYKLAIKIFFSKLNLGAIPKQID